MHKLCDKSHRCNECPLDKALQDAAKKNRSARRQGKIPLIPDGRIAYTRERLKLLPAGERPCLLYANGLIDYKICCSDYECVFCEFDRYFTEQYQVHAVVRPLDIMNIRSFRLPQGYYYHLGHTWVRIEEKAEVCIGIDDFALQLIGPMDRIELPFVGHEVRQGQNNIKAIREERQIALQMPVSGIVSAINLTAREKTALVTEDPYASGWLIKVQTYNLRRDLKNLTIGSESVKWLNREIDRLNREFESSGEMPVDTTANSDDDMRRAVSAMDWERISRLFLHT
ncbi:MAG: glycine cleavage system protein H [Desulfosarcina sp.]|nr:glycine cleavage system protein H [Desulfobacterales bacterium]